MAEQIVRVVLPRSRSTLVHDFVEAARTHRFSHLRPPAPILSTHRASDPRTRGPPAVEPEEPGGERSVTPGSSRIPSHCSCPVVVSSSRAVSANAGNVTP